MNSDDIQWFLMGAAVVGAAWAVSRLIRTSAVPPDDANFGHPGDSRKLSPHPLRQNLEQPRETSQQETRTTVEAQRESGQKVEPQPPAVDVPYSLDNRPMPEGNDTDRLLPRRIGRFQRRESGGDIHDMVWAGYSDGRSEISMWVAICSSPVDARSGVDTARLESADVTEAVLASSIGTEPSFHLTRFINPRMGATGKGTGITWNRGRYYFSADATTGELLDSFMDEFPF